MKKLLQKKFDILLIDEYNTSKKCCNCLKDVGHQKFRLLTCDDCVGK